MLKKVTVIICFIASSFGIQPCPPGTPPATISETFSSTAAVKIDNGGIVLRGTGIWSRSLTNLAYYAKYSFDDGTSAKYWGFFEEGKRVRYSIKTTKDGISTCTSAPIRDDEQFEYFGFLKDAQCFEHTEGGVTLDARATLDSESKKIRVVEVERNNPSILYRYTEQVNDYEEQLTFHTFVPGEPNPSEFNVPAEICGQLKFRQHLYRY